jgi:hypothetical protein
MAVEPMQNFANWNEKFGITVNNFSFAYVTSNKHTLEARTHANTHTKEKKRALVIQQCDREMWSTQVGILLNRFKNSKVKMLK